MSLEDEPVQDEESLETAEGRESSVDNGEIDAREAAFMQGYESDEKDEDEDFGLDDDEKMGD